MESNPTLHQHGFFSLLMQTILKYILAFGYVVKLVKIRQCNSNITCICWRSHRPPTVSWWWDWKEINSHETQVVMDNKCGFPRWTSLRRGQLCLWWLGDSIVLASGELHLHILKSTPPGKCSSFWSHHHWSSVGGTSCI